MTHLHYLLWRASNDKLTINNDRIPSTGWIERDFVSANRCLHTRFFCLVKPIPDRNIKRVIRLRLFLPKKRRSGGGKK